jgi:hypothetical protein
MTKPKFDVVPCKQTFLEMKAEFQAKEADRINREAIDLSTIILDQFRIKLSDEVQGDEKTLRLQSEHLSKPHVRSRVEKTLADLGYKTSFTKESRHEWSCQVETEAYLTVTIC